MKQPKPQPEKPYGGMTRAEWLAKIEQAKTGDEVMALARLAPPAPDATQRNPDSWIDQVATKSRD